MQDLPCTESERYPWLTEPAKRNLLRMLESVHAPTFNHQCGDRLDPKTREQCAEFEKSLAGPLHRPSEPEPAWLNAFQTRCVEHVPIYRQLGRGATRFSELPTVGRKDLYDQPWAFVPDNQPLDDLMVYFTSGTTGRHLDILSHPYVSTCYLILLKKVLAEFGIRLKSGPDQVVIALVCAQKSTYTYASVSGYLDGAGFIKINLNSSDWPEPEAIGAYLRDMNPQIISGDPLALAHLRHVAPALRPDALVSSAMTLSEPFAQALTKTFECPVLNVYSMNECRLLAYQSQQGFRLASPDVYMEIMDPDQDQVLQPGQWGELVVTCPRNPFLPLLRYRTGDFGRLQPSDSGWLIQDFEGRPPVAFRTQQGTWINNIDISAKLRDLPWIQFTLHQKKSGDLVLELLAEAHLIPKVTQRLKALFGAGQKIQVKTFDPNAQAKPIQYSSVLDQQPVNLSFP
ncbi:MAG: hypothetical protein H6510_16475 [Acidobacteria bacterium]|nr:hypothetical protein [Acidobacteriota bacterium]MCB9399410.1 hypothetical protein [Acidobacteriota bacterium]